MTLSFNEVEATAKKAAKGAGYAWGLAEEAAKATRWLCKYQLDGVGALAGLLKQVDDAKVSDRAPRFTSNVWSASEGLLCPLVAGSVVSDRAQFLTQDMRFAKLAQPIFVLPFAASMARQTKQTVTVSWEGAEAVTDGTHVCFSGEAVPFAQFAAVRLGGAMDVARRMASRTTPNPEDWEMINAFAHRTYAPATEESRLKGAGAGTSDND